MGDGDGSDEYDDRNRDRIGSSSETDGNDQQIDDEEADDSGVDDSNTPHGNTDSFQGTADSFENLDDESPSGSENSDPTRTDSEFQRGSEPSTRNVKQGSKQNSGKHSKQHSGQDSSSRNESGDQVTIEDDGLLRWFFKTDDGTVLIVRDILTSVAIVAVIGLVLFGISGIWPPLVAVESGSMDPNMQEGDLIFVVDDERFVGDDPVDGTGIVTLENGQESGHDKFGKHGDVVVFQPGGSATETPVIHRAHFWVEEGDNWVDEQADPEIIGNDVTCDDIQTCPAEHEGFITKGDNNNGYDQQANAGTNSDSIVRPEWVTGKASFRIPWLGNVRLMFDEYLLGTTGESMAVPSEAIGGVSAGASGLAGAVAIAGKRRFGRY